MSSLILDADLMWQNKNVHDQTSNDPVSVRFWSIRAAARRQLHGFIIVNKD